MIVKVFRVVARMLVGGSNYFQSDCSCSKVIDRLFMVVVRVSLGGCYNLVQWLLWSSQWLLDFSDFSLSY